MTGIPGTGATPLQFDWVFPGGTRVDVFQNIYWVFLLVGTLVGVVVIGYMLYNAYKYRDRGDDEGDDVDRPSLGELPEGGGKGKKLFLSFALSAIIVISLIVWTYAMLLYVEAGDGSNANAQAQATGSADDTSAQAGSDALMIHVEGYRFGWQYTYPNGYNSTTLRIPEDRRIQLNVTSRDVIHNFGIPAFRAKTDAIPGQYTYTWFVANETGTYQAQCYELCGAGHSYMVSDVQVMSQSEYQQWYGNVSSNTTSNDNGTQARVEP
jgi:cytochrome c oxidase subunit 2